MSGLFGPKKDPVKETNKVLRGAQRDIERDRNQLDREKKKLELEIKKMAKEGNKQACVVLAKQLLNLRKQETRSCAAASSINGIKTQNQIMASNAKIGQAMKTTTDNMVMMNKLMDPQKTAKIMGEFEKQNMKMNMTDEMINDTLDGILDGSDDEAQSDAIVNKVLDEIGIEIHGKLNEAPNPSKSKLGASSKVDDDDEEIKNMLARLKA